MIKQYRKIIAVVPQFTNSSQNTERMQVLFISASIILTLSVSPAQRVNISCNDPPAVGFAEVSDTSNEGYAKGTTVTYECQFGYTLKGESRTVQCVESDTEDGVEWTKPQFSCFPQSCGDPGYIHNGRRIGSLFTFPNSVKYECDKGYKIVGLSTRYCQTSGTWSGILPRCEVLSCKPPKDIVNGHVTYTSLEYGSELKYKCDKGFLLSTGETVFCAEDGQWSKKNVTCLESTCDTPLKPEGGSILLGGSNEKPRAGSIAIFSCDDGRILDGSSTSKCLETGQWSFPAPKCLQPCSVPYVTDGKIGRYVKKSRWDSRRVFKEVEISTIIEDDEEMVLRCSEGHEVLDSSKMEEKIFCKQGKWSVEPYCIPASCRGEPPPVDNAEIESLNPEHGGSVSYRCHTDFKKIRNETVICEFGHWKGTTSICKKTKCSTDVLEFPGLLRGQKSSYKDGEQYEIVCDSNYRIANGGKLTCVEGEWKEALPPCIPASCKKSPPDVNHATAEISSRTHGSTVKYICEYPFTLRETYFIHCSFGEWKGQLPSCVDSRCYLKDLPALYHVSRDSPSVTDSGNRLNVICKEGYSPKVEVPLCQNGQWREYYVSPCEENHCSVPRLYHGDVVMVTYGDYYFNFLSFSYHRTTHRTKIHAGIVVPPATSYTLICRRGYSFKGTRTIERDITCAKGRWFPDPVCNPLGTTYVPTTSAPRRKTTSASRQRIPVDTPNKRSSTTTTESTPITSATTVEQDINAKTDEVSTTESGSVVSDCLCEYPVNDENLVATVDGKPLKFGDIVKNESVVVFRCKHVGYHRFKGPREIKCENCGRWHSSSFPTCTNPKQGNAVILLDKNITVTAEGNLEVRKGESVTMSCVSVEWAEYPTWNYPNPNGIFINNEKKDRKTIGDVLYVSHLEIEKADFVNEGRYECAVEENSATVVQLEVTDPNVRCTAFEEMTGISIEYERGGSVKSKALFSCSNKSQELVGKAAVTCLRNGEWSHPAPSCKNVKCKELKGNDLLEIHYLNEREVGSLATFHCFFPGKRNGVSHAKCLANASWSDPTPTCTTSPCPVGDLFSGLPRNVVPNMEEVKNDTLPYNTTIKMMCGGKFIVVGNPTATCGKNGTWEVDTVKCISGCPSPKKMPDSKLITSPEKDSYNLGETVTLTCPPGMKLKTNSQLLMCLKTGWSDPISPECEGGEYSEDYEDDAESTDQESFS